MSNDGDELSGESDISNNDGGEMGTRGEAELVLDTLSLLRKLNTTTRSGGAAEEDNIAGLLSVLSDRGLLKSSFEKLKLFLRVRDKAKLRQTQELLQSHLQLLQERSLALKKANIKTMERQEALLQKEKLILNLRTQLQEAKMKAVYAQENFLLDQLENEGKMLREIEREIEKSLRDVQFHKTEEYCRFCLAELSRLPSEVPASQVVPIASRKEMPLEKRRELAKAHIINALRHQNSLQAKGSKLREDYAQELRDTIEHLYASFKTDASLCDLKVKPKLLMSTANHLRANLATIKCQVMTTISEAKSALEIAERQIIRKLQVLQTKTESSAMIPDILSFFDSLYDTIRTSFRTLQWPESINKSNLLSEVNKTRDRLSTTNFQDAKSLYDAVGGVVSAVTGTTTKSLTHMAQVMKELEVEILANQKKILKLESRLENVADEGVENSEAVKKYQQRVKLLERQLTRERALAEKKISMAAQSAGGNLQNLDLGMGSQISLSFQDEFTHRDVGTNTSLMSTTEVETMIQLAVRPPRNCSTNTALLGSSGTQTDKYHRRNIKFTVGNRYRGVHRAIQTIDFDFSSTQTQTDLVTHREVCCGLSKTDTATVTEAEFYPGHVDGVTTTTTTFCLAQSKTGAASRAYSEVRYICIDDESQEEPAEPVLTIPGVEFILQRLRHSLRGAFQRIDTLRLLLTAFQKFQEKLKSQQCREITFSHQVEDVPQGPDIASVGYLPKAVADILSDSPVFDKQVALAHMPPLTPSPPVSVALEEKRNWRKRNIPSHSALIRAEKRSKAPVRLPVLSLAPLTACR